jgi:hypothetical protein
MKEVRYIIKVTATGTEHNPNEKFRGCINIYYYGVDQTCIGHKSTVDSLGVPTTPTAYNILTYGYKSKAAANKATKLWTSPSKVGCIKFWEYTTEVLAYEFVDGVLITPIKLSTNSYNLKARVFHRKYNDIVNTPIYESSSNDRRIAYNLYHIYLRDCAQLEAATSSPTTLSPIITSPSICCAADRMLDETDAELESIVSRMENLAYNHKAHSWKAKK